MNYHNGLTVTQDELDLIARVRTKVETHNQNLGPKEKKEKIWDQEELSELKAKIKGHYRTSMGELCCYCRKNFHGEFNMVIDIEHILPKKHFAEYEFSPFNLNIACKRCNMNIKGEDIAFLNNTQTGHDNPSDNTNYKIIHPNFDVYEEHLDRIEMARNAIRLIKYSVVNNSNKGRFTYDYMELKKLEAVYMNTAQGIQQVDMSNLATVAAEIREQINTLLNI